MTGRGDASVRIAVEAGPLERGYHVVIKPGVRTDLARLLDTVVAADRYVLVSDETVAELYTSEITTTLKTNGHDVDLLTFPAGEGSKSRVEWGRLSDAMIELGAGRRSAVVAVGGGVTGDLAGFVAATFMRGVPVVQLPTTLLAMIDASVGGKTGLNTAAGKNLIGAFHPPALVVVDPEFGATLSRAQRAEGLAEALKHGAILDAEYFQDLVERADALLEGDSAATAWAVERSVRIKADVVSRDERESGLREILNFGHTVGHALEAASDYSLGHGHAIAIGMVYEAALGERLSVTEPGTSRRLQSAVERLGLPAVLPAQVDVDVVDSALRKDKKGRRAGPRFVLLEALGRVAAEGSAWSRDVADAEIERIVEAASSGQPPA